MNQELIFQKCLSVPTQEDPEDEGEVEEDNDVVIDTEEYVSTYQTVLEDALPPALEEVSHAVLRPYT